MSGQLQIDGPGLLARIQALGRIGALAGGGVCRLALSEEDRRGRDQLVAWMRELELEVSIDRIGNIVGTLAGRRDLAPVMMGSHIDTVATGGLYDGALGVLAGLEVVAALRRAGITPERPVQVAAFTNEEGSRFAPDMMGSLVYQGDLPLEAALDTVGIDGTSVRANLERIGYAGPAPVGVGRPHAYLELHVEQGPVLEHEGLEVGAVTGVQGICWTEFTVSGVSNHAGTTPMRLRHDAGAVFVEIARFVRTLTQRYGAGQLGTVGHCRLHPNLVNVIPAEAIFTVDLRNTDKLALDGAEAELLAFAAEAAAQEGVEITHRSLARFDPVAFAPALVDLVERKAQGLGRSVRRLPSGAGHDAQIMARLCPAAMIFVPSVGGLSHNPAEYTKDADLITGAQILLEALFDLSAA
ncbi:Zn-dependent hydrolase [Devosia sp.]|uniref:Zn-dependent hydrolase n=1 Tax=Devosia sp. TaxID=1871048 RepID=UPI002F1B48AD